MPWIDPPQWPGRTVVCIASGPSLTEDDCAKVREAGLTAVVTNTTFRRCPWANALFAFDARWWKVHHHEVMETFRGRRFGGSMLCENYGANPMIGVPWFRLFTNSGASAISLAVAGGASKIILIGFDASVGPAGESHWHGDHPAGLSNAESMAEWSAQFKAVANLARERGAAVINASRQTALSHFPRGSLESVL